MDILCEDCVYYVYDCEEDYSECMMQIDEDDAIRITNSGAAECPYFRMDDEYGIVRKQN